VRLALDNRAELTRMQQAFAASQADLSRVEQALLELRQDYTDLDTAFVVACGSREFNRTRALKAEAELATAQAELARLRTRLDTEETTDV